MSTISHSYGNVQNWDKAYKRLLSLVSRKGSYQEYRNGLAVSLFGVTITVDPTKDFPVTRLRDMEPEKKILPELMANLRFGTSLDAYPPEIQPHWRPYADADGELGATAYARQLRLWPQSAEGASVANEQLDTTRPVDQVAEVACTLRAAKHTGTCTRRATLILHNPTAIGVAQPTCHSAMHFTIGDQGKTLNLHVTGRSQDLIIGLPGDLPRFCALLMVMAQHTGFEVGRVMLSLADAHIYKAHFANFDVQCLLSRPSRRPCYLKVTGVDKLADLSQLTDANFKIEHYHPHKGFVPDLTPTRC